MSHTSTSKLLTPPKSTRFKVEKLYDRLHEELISHMSSNNNQIAVKLIKSRPKELDYTDENGVTLLMTACTKGSCEVVKALLQSTSHVNIADLDGWTPLMYACRDGFHEIVKELLDANADMERRDMGGWTALMWACYKGHLACAEELVVRKANVNIKAMYNMTCLHWAAGRGYAGIVELLLKNGAKVDATDKYGNTPLIWAARKGFQSIVESLLAAGASSDICGMYSWTPLLVALQGGHQNVARTILTTNPNHNVVDKAGMTAIALAAKAGFSDIVSDLLAHGAYLNVLDKNGDTVLHHAVRGGHLDVVRILLKKNPDINVKGNDSKTVLHLSVEKGNVPVMKQILLKNPDKELLDKDGNTALLRAVKNRNFEMTYLLLDQGAKVSAADYKGDTALHVAMRARNRKMLDLLLKSPQHSKFLYLRNKAGETPYNLDSGRTSLLASIFGAKSLNSPAAVESQLGYELYSSALADIVSSPTLTTPMIVGLFAKWGSGKSFMLNKLKEDMKSYMKQSPKIYFQFSKMIFVLNLLVSLVVGLLICIAGWIAGLVSGISVFALLFILEGLLIFLERRYSWEYLSYFSHGLAKKLQKLRLLMYLLLYNTPAPPTGEQETSHFISFLFAESTKLTSMGGDSSLTSMVCSLYDALEKKYGTLVTRLYRVYHSRKDTLSKYKKICCLPAYVFFIGLLICLFAALVMLTVFPNIAQNSLEINIAMLVLGCLVGLAFVMSLNTFPRAVYAYLKSPQRRTKNVSRSQSRGDYFLNFLKQEVSLISSMVVQMDRHENWQTRLVLIIDGLDSCEQEKVIQVLDALQLIIPEDSPFIVLLALDPHVIIKGIESNNFKGINDGSITGYGYLMNIIHLPFYLQNHGLPRMHTSNEREQLKKWQNVKESKHKQAADRQSSLFSSTISLDVFAKGKPERKMSIAAESQTVAETLQGYLSVMPKGVIKDDYFIDISPRSLRRLLNIVGLASRLLRANDMDFNWYRLSAWIHITEQWPYRTSWLLLHYEEMEGKLEDSMTLLQIYEQIRQRIPRSRDIEPLLDIDRNESKFVTFLKSHTPRLCVDDIKKFMPATINMDPFLRKIIKDKTKNQDYLMNSQIQDMPRLPNTYDNFRYQAPPENMMLRCYPQSEVKQGRIHRSRIPAEVKLLSKLTVLDVCDLLPKIKGMSAQKVEAYKTVISKNNINGIVLTDCDIDELKSVLNMAFGDWQLFKSTILAMREVDLYQSNTSLSFSEVNLALVKQASKAADADDASYHSSMPGTPSIIRKIPAADDQKDEVYMENQMILNAMQNLIPESDDEFTSAEEDEEQQTVKPASNPSPEVPVVTLNTGKSEIDVMRNVTFALVDECDHTDKDTAPLVNEGTDLSIRDKDTRDSASELQDAKYLKSNPRLGTLPVIIEGGRRSPSNSSEDTLAELTSGYVNLAFNA